MNEVPTVTQAGLGRRGIAQIQKIRPPRCREGPLFKQPVMLGYGMVTAAWFDWQISADPCSGCTT
jgi:hypothetical protein